MLDEVCVQKEQIPKDIKDKLTNCYSFDVAINH